jgi:hypothetical protein
MLKKPFCPHGQPPRRIFNQSKDNKNAPLSTFPLETQRFKSSYEIIKPMGCDEIYG